MMGICFKAEIRRLFYEVAPNSRARQKSGTLFLQKILGAVAQILGTGIA
jgi:hypothetical protein